MDKLIQFIFPAFKIRGDNDRYFDNLKFFLIWSIVFGHILTQFLDFSLTIRNVYFFIYLFHIPTFVFLSGYFYKKNTSHIFSRILKYLLLYFVFQVLYSWYFHVEAQFIIPIWILWYLSSLISWLLIASLLPINKKTVAGSIIFSLILGAFPDISNAFSLPQTFYFLPFFLIGAYIRKNNYKINYDRIKLAGGFLLAVAFLFITILNFYFNFDHQLLFGKFGYTFFSQTPITGAIVRLLVYFISLLVMAGVFQLIPKTRSIASTLGQATLFIYLLHGFFVRINLYGVSSLKNASLILLFALVYSFLIISTLGGLRILIDKYISLYKSKKSTDGLKDS